MLPAACYTCVAYDPTALRYLLPIGSYLGRKCNDVSRIRAASVDGTAACQATRHNTCAASPLTLQTATQPLLNPTHTPQQHTPGQPTQRRSQLQRRHCLWRPARSPTRRRNRSLHQMTRRGGCHRRNCLELLIWAAGHMSGELRGKRIPPRCLRRPSPRVHRSHRPYIASHHHFTSTIHACAHAWIAGEGLTVPGGEPHKPVCVGRASRGERCAGPTCPVLSTP
jgi:hypothetical protein